MAKLGEICAFQSGGTPSKNKPEYFGGEIPWISTTALNGGKINEADAVAWITPKAIRESAAKIVPANSIMVGTRVGIGKVAINTVEMSTSQDVISLIGIDKDKWYKPYLCKLLLSKKDYFNSQARGATIKGIKIDVVANIDVPEIDYATQRKVAATLNKIDTLIVLRKQQLAKLDELVKARFVEMFGDFEVNPKEFPVYHLCELCDVGSSKRIYQEEQSISGIPFLKVADLNELIDTGKYLCSTFIPLERYEQLLHKELTPKENDILITSRGTLGKCYIVQSDDEFYFQDGMISWLSNLSPKVSSIYISYLFAQPYIQKQIESLQAGSTVAYLSIAMLKKMNVILPPKKLQDDFATFVEHVDQQKQTVQQSLEKLELMKKALMQEYFG